MAQIKVLHLEMDGEHYYFGSPKAMFDIMGAERMGMTYRSFHSNIRLHIGEPYKNRRHGYIIRVGLLGQAKTNRNNHLRERAKLAEVAQVESVIEVAAAQEQTLPDVAVNASAQKRKKKEKDIPEQLTLF